MPYVGRDAASFTTVVDVTVSDDLTVTDDATIGGTLGVTGKITADAGIDIDNINIDGTTIALSSGDLTVDVTGDIILDADGGDFVFKDGGSGDEANKVIRFSTPSHDTDEENVQILQVENEASSNQITFGGGTSALNTATTLRFMTGAVDTTAGTERMRINSTGVSAITSGGGIASTAAQLFVQSNGSNVGTGTHTLYAESSDQVAGHTGYFYSNSTQTGNVCRIYKDGAGDASALFVHTDGLFTVAEFNRQSNDGIIIDLKQAGTSEGTISVSGATVTYNAFSGSHWSRLSDNSKPDLLRGTVIETIDAMCVWYHLEYTIPQVNYTKDDEDIPSDKKIGDERYGSQPLVVNYEKPDNVNVGDKIDYDHNGTTYEATITKNGDVKHVQCKVSDTADSTRVYGVFLSWDNDDDSVNDMYVTAVGTNLLRVHKDQTISAGDLLVSNGDGTAKKQDDDIIRSKTIGKALTNIKQETYDDGSFTIPCALYCG